jgi:hypothetical protein
MDGSSCICRAENGSVDPFMCGECDSWDQRRLTTDDGFSHSCCFQCQEVFGQKFEKAYASPPSD